MENSNIKKLNKPVIITDFTHKKMNLKITSIKEVGDNKTKIAFCVFSKENQDGSITEIKTSVKLGILLNEASKFLGKNYKEIKIKEIESLRYNFIGFKGFTINKFENKTFYIRNQKHSYKFYISFITPDSGDLKNDFQKLCLSVVGNVDKIIVDYEI